MSTTIIAVIINLLSVGLPYIGVTIGSGDLTTTVQTLVAVLTGIWIWFRRVQVGDISVAGIRK